MIYNRKISEMSEEYPFATVGSGSVSNSTSENEIDMTPEDES